MNKTDLKLYLIPGDYRYNYDSNLYLKAYQCWKEVWNETWEEVGVKKEIKSDNFSRQDFIYVITEKDTVVGTMFMKKFNPQDPLLFEDSYFSYEVPSDVQTALRGMKQDFFIVNSLAVKKEFRRKQIGLYLVTAIVQFLKHSPEIESVFCTTRNHAGIDKVVQLFNAQYQTTVHVDYGQLGVEPSSIFLFLENAFIPDNLSEIANDLWENKVDYYSLSHQKEEVSS